MEIKDKDEAAKILRERGFNSENIDNVVITKFELGNPKEYYIQKVTEVKNILDEIGYKTSRGFYILKKEDS